jgi:DNA repair protein RecN (Recombination protein N)
MLMQLEIRNIALIDNICIEFGEGLNILTGETGAGKSVIIDSINMLIGERFSKEMIRTGREKASIEAVFKITPGILDDIFENFGIYAEIDNTVIISRDFNISGKNTSRINGKLVTTSAIKEAGERLIDIHGQYENQSLLKLSTQAALLDAYGGEEVKRLKHDYSKQFEEYKLLSGHLSEALKQESSRLINEDRLKYQISEIKKAKLMPGEEDALNKQRHIMANAEKITDALAKSHTLLYSGNNIRNSACDAINEAVSQLSSIISYDNEYKNIKERLEEISYLLEDIVSEIRIKRDMTEYDPDSLDKIEERLDVIDKLKKKYGGNHEEIVLYLKQCEEELESLYTNSETIEHLRNKLAAATEMLYLSAIALNVARIKAATSIDMKITETLNELDMKKAGFKADIRFEEKNAFGDRRFVSDGLDKIEFMISTNPGEPLKPLAKIASGGEMSRVMLAIKSILSEADKIPVLIFDEIDTGIGGKAVRKIAEKLYHISKNHQVICVTHLAQIASMGDCNYVVEKYSDDKNATTFVKKLEGNDILDEIARLLDAESKSSIARTHAGEMLESALAYKKSS